MLSFCKDLCGPSRSLALQRGTARRYPRSGAAAARRRFKVGTPAGVGDATHCGCRAVPSEGPYSMIPLIPARQGLNEVPLGGGSEVTPKPREQTPVSLVAQTLIQK